MGKVESRAGRRDTGKRDSDPIDDSEGAEGYLTIANAAKESGRSVVNFTAFATWLNEESRAIAWQALRRYSARYSTASQIYAVRAVLELWREEVRRLDGQAPGPKQCPDDLVLELSRLREALYRQGISAGNMVTTVSFKWGCFLQFLRDARAVGFLPNFNLHARALRPLPQRFIRSSREAAARDPGRHHGRIPRTLNLKKDSYNEELLEPISISAADDRYLEDYEQRLRQAVQAFRQCALREFLEFERAADEGRALIRGGDYPKLKSHVEKTLGPRRYVDPKTTHRGKRRTIQPSSLTTGACHKRSRSASRPVAPHGVLRAAWERARPSWALSPLALQSPVVAYFGCTPGMGSIGIGLRLTGVRIPRAMHRLSPIGAPVPVGVLVVADLSQFEEDAHPADVSGVNLDFAMLGAERVRCRKLLASIRDDVARDVGQDSGLGRDARSRVGGG